VTFFVSQDERPSAIGETESLSSAKDKTPQTIRTLEPQPEHKQQERSIQTLEKDVEKETLEPEHDQQESDILLKNL
jgi:hypothetical protein